MNKTIIRTFLFVLLLSGMPFEGQGQDLGYLAVEIGRPVYYQVNGWSNGFSSFYTSISSSTGKSPSWGVWYTFQVQNDGYLAFTIEPGNPTVNNDYDFILYEDGNPDLTSSTGTLKACNFSSTGGYTGMRYGGGTNNIGSTGLAFCAPVAVAAGKKYFLFVCTANGFPSSCKISFIESPASVADRKPPNITTASASPSGSSGCSTGVKINAVNVSFSEYVLSGTVSSSTIHVKSGTNEYGISSITPTKLNSSEVTVYYTDNFTINLNSDVTNAGPLTVEVDGGVMDLAGNQIQSAVTYVDVTNNATSLTVDQIASTSCDPDQVQISVPSPAPSTATNTYTWYRDGVVYNNTGTATSITVSAPGSYSLTIDDNTSHCKTFYTAVSVYR
jgi:hypothetical protein